MLLAAPLVLHPTPLNTPPQSSHTFTTSSEHLRQLHQLEPFDVWLLLPQMEIPVILLSPIPVSSACICANHSSNLKISNCILPLSNFTISDHPLYAPIHHVPPIHHVQFCKTQALLHQQELQESTPYDGASHHLFSSPLSIAWKIQALGNMHPHPFSNDFTLAVPSLWPDTPDCIKWPPFQPNSPMVQHCTCSSPLSTHDFLVQHTQFVSPVLEFPQKLNLPPFNCPKCSTGFQATSRFSS